LKRPERIGNIATCYFIHDKNRFPIAVEFNEDASKVDLLVPSEPTADSQTIVFETVENSTVYTDGRTVYSALDAIIRGSNAKLESHPGNHRIGFWTNAGDYVGWDHVTLPRGTYEVELTYSTASPGGTKVTINIGSEKVTTSLKSTGSWYKYTTISLGKVKIENEGKHNLTVRCSKKVGAAVMNLKAIILRPTSKSVKVFDEASPKP